MIGSATLQVMLLSSHSPTPPEIRTMTRLWVGMLSPVAAAPAKDMAAATEQAAAYMTVNTLVCLKYKRRAEERSGR